ncbi:MAG: 4'-phosphopantetheinyl transferase superfamily protein [Nannocystaceae bacterium]|nr:4'-phosphopantetheinyl transferase superfamily protein [Nannocystaceae bacterium]
MTTDVHVFAADVVGDGASTLQRAARLLDGAELAQLRRLAFDADRLAYAAAHVLLRLALSHLRPDREPATWRFVRGPRGRPELAGGERLVFSLSHTRSRVACALARREPGRTLELGIDVEAVEVDPPLQLVDAKFAAREVARVRGLAGTARARAFYEIWTLKEAYLKARGLGLSLPLHAIAIEAGPRLTLDPTLGDDAARWHLHVQHGPSWVQSLAIGCDAGAAPPRLLHESVA